MVKDRLTQSMVEDRLTRRGTNDDGIYSMTSDYSVREKLFLMEEAAEDGSLVLLPAKIGETIWTLGFDGLAEIHPFSRKIVSVTVEASTYGRRIVLNCQDCSFDADYEGLWWWKTEEAALDMMKICKEWYVRWSNM